jgi:hypothetical protein
MTAKTPKLTCKARHDGHRGAGNDELRPPRYTNERLAERMVFDHLCFAPYEWSTDRITDASQRDNSKTVLESRHKGTILSKNHGRIVVLPYIKENGERVQGHTKNGPHDGRATPRHPDDHVELPFEALDGDLMIGLFGELPYE